MFRSAVQRGAAPDIAMSCGAAALHAGAHLPVRLKSDGAALLRSVRRSLSRRIPPGQQQPLSLYEWYLSPDHPDLEASPDMASLDRDYARYAVFWPAPNGAQPAKASWDQDLVRREWVLAHFMPAEGRVAHGANAQAVRGYLYHVGAMHGGNGKILDPVPQGLALSANRAYPSKCP